MEQVPAWIVYTVGISNAVLALGMLMVGVVLVLLCKQILTLLIEVQKMLQEDVRRDLMPSVSADLIDAVHGDGSPLPNMSTFSLRDCFTPAPLIEVTYDSGKYLLLYSVSLFTYVPDEDLGDWDFFVALRRAIDELKLVARVHALGVDMPPEELAGWGIVAAPTGAACPAPGPMSNTQSLLAATRMSCSTTITVLPASTRPCNCSIKVSTSAGCSPVVGSSST